MFYWKKFNPYYGLMVEISDTPDYPFTLEGEVYTPITREEYFINLALINKIYGVKKRPIFPNEECRKLYSEEYKIKRKCYIPLKSGGFYIF
jgi:hypothetical protein